MRNDLFWNGEFSDTFFQINAIKITFNSMQLMQFYIFLAIIGLAFAIMMLSVAIASKKNRSR